MNKQTLMARIKRAQNPAKVVVKSPKLFRLPGREQAKLKLTPRVHLAAIQAGMGDENKFATLAFRLFVAKDLARLLATESRGAADLVLYPAMAALWRIGERAQRLGRVGLSGDDLRILEEALDVADQIQDVCMRREALEVFKSTQYKIGTLAHIMQHLEPYRLN